MPPLQIFPQVTLYLCRHRVYHPICACIQPARTTPAPDPHQSTLRRTCYFYRTGLPPQCLVEVQVRDWLSIDTGVVQQPIMPEFVACAAAASSGEIRGLAARGRLPHWQPARCAKPAPQRNCQQQAKRISRQHIRKIMHAHCNARQCHCRRVQQHQSGKPWRPQHIAQP